MSLQKLLIEGDRLIQGRTVTYVCVAIFHCGIKGQGFTVCEFAILIIMFSVFSDFKQFVLQFFSFHVIFERFFGF